MKAFQEQQLSFLNYLRTTSLSIEVHDNQQKGQSIYRDLVYNNTSKLIGDSFPITKNIISNENWQIMIRGFIATHRSKTPYFLEVCQEFLAYLVEERQPQATDHPFMLELAHFEWIQLALDVADVEIPESCNNFIPTETSEWYASPLAIGLTYSYPVHLIDECYLPEKVNHTYLIAYRNRADDINILVTDALTLRIIQLLQEYKNVNSLRLYQLLLNEISNDNVYNEQLAMTPSTLLLVLGELAVQEIVFLRDGNVY